MTLDIDDPTISSLAGKFELQVVREAYKRVVGFAVLSSLFHCCQGIPLNKNNEAHQVLLQKH
jgi:hypothetical protein